MHRNTEIQVTPDPKSPLDLRETPLFNKTILELESFIEQLGEGLLENSAQDRGELFQKKEDFWQSQISPYKTSYLKSFLSSINAFTRSPNDSRYKYKTLDKARWELLVHLYYSQIMREEILATSPDNPFLVLTLHPDQAVAFQTRTPEHSLARYGCSPDEFMQYSHISIKAFCDHFCLDPQCFRIALRNVGFNNAAFRFLMQHMAIPQKVFSNKFPLNSCPSVYSNLRGAKHISDWKSHEIQRWDTLNDAVGKVPMSILTRKLPDAKFSGDATFFGDPETSQCEAPKKTIYTKWDGHKELSETIRSFTHGDSSDGYMLLSFTKAALRDSEGDPIPRTTYRRMIGERITPLQMITWAALKKREALKEPRVKLFGLNRLEWRNLLANDFTEMFHLMSKSSDNLFEFNSCQPMFKDRGYMAAMERAYASLYARNPSAFPGRRHPDSVLSIITRDPLCRVYLDPRDQYNPEAGIHSFVDLIERVPKANKPQPGSLMDLLQNGQKHLT